MLKYFNPLPRKEGDLSGNYFPTEERAISIHSLVKRETTADFWQVTRRTDFNPLPRKEGDEFKDADTTEVEAISIHSLVKRETNFRQQLAGHCGISIHSLVKRET